MGGKSKAQTIGYKYYLGMHLGLCHGPIDAITQVRVDNREAWSGTATGGSITINAGELFGGDKREGGVSGTIDIAMGGPTQGQNSYLVSKLGALIPAYRGVVGLIFRQCYLGNNPYLKPWAFRGQRIHVRQDGIAQWNDSKAAIPANPSATIDLVQYFPVLEKGVDPGYPNPPSLYPNSITLGPYDTTAQVVAGNPDGSGSCRPDDYFVFNGVQVGSTAAQTYAAGTILYTIPIGDTLTIQIRNTLDTFSGVSGGLFVRFPGRNDMNPAHIIRECLTDPEWGMGYTEDDVDDTSFLAAANIYVNEGLGMSLLWDKTTKIEEFVTTVQQHVDSALYVSRQTGKFVLKPIRGGYDESTLLHLNESNIVSVDDPVRTAFGELVNSVTVTYWDGDTGKDGSVTVTDTALVQQQGVVINSPLQYPGFTNARNATIAAQRDLRALSSPLLACTITADSDAKELEIGDVFKFSWAKWGLVEVVMRVNGISYGTGRNNRVKIQCTQDVFATDTQVHIVVANPGWTDPSAPPSPVDDQLAIEAPYYELVQFLGQADADNKLLTHPEIGYVIAAGSQPASAINASLHTDNGTGYQDVGALDFSPVGFLAADIDKLTTSFTLVNGEDLGEVVLGTHVQIGDELMRVDSLDAATGAITVGRGILDTVPQEHVAGDFALFWDNYAGFDPTEYVDGEEVDVKIVPVSGAGVLPIDEAVAMAVTLDQRAARPYAPGNLRINGDSYADVQYQGVLAITWTHRDRLQQTAGSFVDATAGDIGPEPGTTYRLRGYIDGVLTHTEDDIAGNTTSWTPDTEGRIRLEVHSKRDGLYSWQAPWHEFYYVGSDIRITEEAGERRDEDGKLRVTED